MRKLILLISVGFILPGLLFSCVIPEGIGEVMDKPEFAAGGSEIPSLPLSEVPPPHPDTVGQKTYEHRATGATIEVLRVLNAPGQIPVEALLFDAETYGDPYDKFLSPTLLQVFDPQKPIDPSISLDAVLVYLSVTGGSSGVNPLSIENMHDVGGFPKSDDNYYSPLSASIAPPEEMLYDAGGYEYPCIPIKEENAVPGTEIVPLPRLSADPSLPQGERIEGWVVCPVSRIGSAGMITIAAYKNQLQGSFEGILPLWWRVNPAGYGETVALNAVPVYKDPETGERKTGDGPVWVTIEYALTYTDYGETSGDREYSRFLRIYPRVYFEGSEEVIRTPQDLIDLRLRPMSHLSSDDFGYSVQNIWTAYYEDGKYPIRATAVTPQCIFGSKYTCIMDVTNYYGENRGALKATFNYRLWQETFVDDMKARPVWDVQVTDIANEDSGYNHDRCYADECVELEGEIYAVVDMGEYASGMAILGVEKVHSYDGSWAVGSHLNYSNYVYSNIGFRLPDGLTYQVEAGDPYIYTLKVDSPTGVFDDTRMLAYTKLPSSEEWFRTMVLACRWGVLSQSNDPTQPFFCGDIKSVYGMPLVGMGKEAYLVMPTTPIDKDVVATERETVFFDTSEFYIVDQVAQIAWRVTSP